MKFDVFSRHVVGRMPVSYESRMLAKEWIAIICVCEHIVRDQHTSRVDLDPAMILESDRAPDLGSRFHRITMPTARFERESLLRS